MGLIIPAWLTVAVALLASGALASPSESRYEAVVSLETAQVAPLEAFRRWAEHHKKDYVEVAEEFERRFEIFKDNLEYILDYNANNQNSWLHLNAFADLTNAEFGKLYTGLKVTQEDLNARAARNSPFRHADVEAADEVDWRKEGAVSEVKNQGQCGSCWAFSTTGSIEGANFLATGQLVSLSEQELVDCDPGDNGCQGGLMDNAFQYIIQNGGLDTESDYPYVASNGACNKRKLAKHVVSIDSFEDVPPMSEADLKKAVTKQPVSVAIQANERVFQLYGGGIIDGACGTSLDHGVLAVGYSSAEKFWIVKNSWGDWWGEAGYVRLAFGKNGNYGQCGICTIPSYPVKTGPNPPPVPPGPPPSPTPVPPEPKSCDQMGVFQCEADQTCCCQYEISGYCLMYACCPYPEATCCDDHQSCCPSDHPVCDVAAGECKASADSTDVVQLGQKQPATTGAKFLDNLDRKSAVEAKAVA